MELRGQPAAKALTEDLSGDIEALRRRGTLPRLAVVRLGARADDLAYERGIAKRFGEAGCEAVSVALSESCPQPLLEETLCRLNRDCAVHGVLVLRPLPAHIEASRVESLISPEKDVDGMNPVSLGRLFRGEKGSFAPCTARAVLELLDFYHVSVSGKRVTVVGRSAVVGRPLLALLLARDATVTLCHTKTADLACECRRAEILVACAGKPGLIAKEHVGAGATVVDVGICEAEGKLVGDVSPEARAAAAHYSPVPGGVGALTTAVLLKHTVLAASRAAR